MIRENKFDFFDIGDVKELSLDKHQAQLLGNPKCLKTYVHLCLLYKKFYFFKYYLSDFIGVLKLDCDGLKDGLSEFVNANGKEQCNFRFEITYGRYIYTHVYMDFLYLNLYFFICVTNIL